MNPATIGKMNKKGGIIVLEEVIFILLNLMFFAIFLFFVINSSSGAFVLEQFYAKQIALLIDTSKPGTIISLDITDAYNLAEKNNVDSNKIVSTQDGHVIVQLSRSRTYKFPFFSDVIVEKPVYSIGDGRIFLNLQISEK